MYDEVLTSAQNCEITVLIPQLHAAPRALSVSGDDEEEDLLGSKKKQKRGVLPKQATSIMRSWLFQHIVVSIVCLVSY